MYLGLLESWELDAEAEDVISQELGITSHDLYFAPTSDAPSGIDSDPEEDLRAAIFDEQLFVEAVSNIKELQHLQSELKRARAKIRSLEAQVRSLENIIDQSLDKCSPRSHNDAQGTCPGTASRKRVAIGEISYF